MKLLIIRRTFDLLAPFFWKRRKFVFLETWTEFLSFYPCPNPCTDDNILHKNHLMNLFMLKPLYSLWNPVHVLSLKGPSSGITDIFHEPGQQNTCVDVNIRLKGNVLYVTQLPHSA